MATVLLSCDDDILGGNKHGELIINTTEVYIVVYIYIYIYIPVLV